MKKLMIILIFASYPVYAQPYDDSYANQVRQQDEMAYQQQQIQDQQRQMDRQQIEIDNAQRGGNDANPFGFNYTNNR